MIWTLHGFLGLPADWDVLPWPHRPLPLDGLDPAVPTEASDVLIGYSMGGRLALSILERRRFRKAVLVSAGLNAPDEARRARDEEWARRFETEEWTSVVRAWNAQPVFGGHVVERREEDYDRRQLARALRQLSPAVLAPPHLERIETPLLWIAGERDAKYVAIAQEGAAALPHGYHWICPGAGHRVPWEQPQLFVERLRDFLELQ